MKIALARHGQTEENYSRKVQGRRNVLLNDTGRRQCQKLRDKIRDKQYDVCYVSPLARCVETAFILIGDRTEMIKDERLLERDMGKLEARPFEEYDSKAYWNYDQNKSDFGVEPIQDLFVRCQSLLDYIKEKHEGQSILIVTHAAPYRALRYLLLNHKLEGDLFDGYIENAQYEEFEIDN